MRLTFHPRARNELWDAVDYYEEARSGLGEEFLDEFHSTCERILETPRAWSKQTASTRRCLMKRFPYSVIYQLVDEQVRVIAVAHQKRRPGYWETRL
ncbi:MAG: type II toxin-antitoxin system RelE/ParE family toxin [Acidobacteriota bacterium]